MALVCSYFNLPFANSLSYKIRFLRSQAFNQHSQDSQPVVDAIEPEESISQESTGNYKRNGNMKNTIAHDRIARKTHACVSKVVRDFDSCRNTSVDKVQCKRRHPACSHVVSTHGTPKCQPVYGFRDATFVTRCPSLPIDCQCAI